MPTKTILGALTIWTLLIVSSPNDICRSVSLTTPERTPECISLIQEAVGALMDRKYARQLIPPDLIKYYFWGEARSEAQREFNHKPGGLGFYTNAPPEIVILYSTDTPVELIIAHEQVHAFQDINGLEPSEVQARDISLEAFIHLFSFQPCPHLPDGHSCSIEGLKEVNRPLHSS